MPIHHGETESQTIYYNSGNRGHYPTGCPHWRRVCKGGGKVTKGEGKGEGGKGKGKGRVHLKGRATAHPGSALRDKKVGRLEGAEGPRGELALATQNHPVASTVKGPFQ